VRGGAIGAAIARLPVNVRGRGRRLGARQPVGLSEGSSHRSSENRANPRSKETSVAFCSIAMAARCTSVRSAERGWQARTRR